MTHKLMKAVNGIEVSVFDGRDSPFTLDLYMRQFMKDRRRTIKAFHAELTPEMAEELAKDLCDRAYQVRIRQIQSGTLGNIFSFPKKKQESKNE